MIKVSSEDITTYSSRQDGRLKINRQTVHVVLDVSDHEVVRHRYDTPRGVPVWFAPRSLAVTFSRQADEITWKHGHIRLWGYQIKADGTPGAKERINDTYGSDRESEEVWPTWAREAVQKLARLMPNGWVRGTA